MLLLCLLTLGAGYVLKEKCPPQDSGSYPRLCYSDIPVLFHARQLDDGALPYLDFPEGGSYAARGFFEYPVGTGVVAAATARVAPSPRAYLLVNALVLGLVGLACALMLLRLDSGAATRWAASPLLALFAFHNWDLLAVGCVVAALFARSRQRPGLAGALLGLGAAVKIYPVLFLAPLVLERLSVQDRRGAARAAAGGVVALLLPNVLIASANLDGWWATYAFHRDRGADIGSVWFHLLPDTSPTTLNLLSGMLLLLTALATLALGWRHASRAGVYPLLPVASALVALFLLFSKIASPQYFLWLLPSLALLRMGLRWWISWNVVGVIVYVVSFGVGLDSYTSEQAPDAIEAAAWLRGAALVALLLVFLRMATRANE